MSIDREKLTAYALGELSGAEAAAVEKALAGDETARRFVDEVRAFGQAAERDLRREPLPSGRGAAPVLAEIAGRPARNGPGRKQWIQAALLGALVVLFFLAYPLRHHFGGNVAKLGGSLNDTATSVGPEEQEGLTHRSPREDPRALANALAALAARPRELRQSGPCTALLPETRVPEAIQTDGATLAAGYILSEGGIALEIRLRSAPQPLVHGLGIEEAEQRGAYKLFRENRGEANFVYYAVPGSGTENYCQIQVVTDWIVPEESKRELARALPDLARSIAESIVVREK